MRISDWSSDVCSSDLRAQFRPPAEGVAFGCHGPAVAFRKKRCSDLGDFCRDGALNMRRIGERRDGGFGLDDPGLLPCDARRRIVGRSRFGREQESFVVDAERSDRSEEHTSELQSLMRIAYAVFCLK